MDYGEGGEINHVLNRQLIFVLNKLQRFVHWKCI